MFKRLLVPLDGSPLAELALPHARSLAQTYQAELVLLRITDKSKGEASAQERMRYLEEQAAPLREAGLACRVRLEYGDPAQIIVDQAESEEIDLVVMCSHGRSGLARWVYGSVAERVLSNARCPLFLIRNRQVPG